MGFIGRAIGWIWRRWGDYQSGVAIIDLFDAKTFITSLFGGVLMVLFGATNSDWSPQGIVLAALIAAACIAALSVFLRWLWLSFKTKGATPAREETANSVPSLIADNFSAAAAAIAALGKQHDQIRVSSNAYQAIHENAVVLWIRSLGKFYRFPKYSKQPIASIVQDQDWDVDHKWANDKELRKIFKTPKGKLPPYLGIAKNWNRDPPNWSWIGWRVWHCYMGTDKVYYQEFENGVVIGPVRLSPRETDDASQMYIYLNNGSWDQRGMMVAAPACVPPQSYVEWKD